MQQVENGEVAADVEGRSCLESLASALMDCPLAVRAAARPSLTDTILRLMAKDSGAPGFALLASTARRCLLLLAISPCPPFFKVRASIWVFSFAPCFKVRASIWEFPSPPSKVRALYGLFLGLIVGKVLEFHFVSDVRVSQPCGFRQGEGSYMSSRLRFLSVALFVKMGTLVLTNSWGS